MRVKVNELYYGVQVSKDISKDGEIFLLAESVQVTDGVLTFYYSDKHGLLLESLCLAKGQWFSYYAASCLDGHPCKVEHWKGLKAE